ncbi:MAG: hypothetical protein HYX52_07005 [Chloroflexi bacterium]|nr:hypothetical protein [Chloroflexota bacterium]
MSSSVAPAVSLRIPVARLRHGRGWTRATRSRPDAVLLGVLAVYTAIVAWLLWASGGFPYVMDGNESFSAYLHATNMLRFGVGGSSGLADESNAIAAAAHPYVYTHGGNFPRFFSFVLLLAGMTDIRWHIALAALIIGGLSTIFCFKLFSTIANRWLAALVCLVFATDYLLYAQWQVNSFRVWQGFFFFGQLYLVQLAARGANRRVAMLTVALALSYTYFELSFAVFVAAAATMYAILTFRGAWRSVLRVVLPVGLGCFAGAVILLTQVFMQLGPERALEDLRLTYLARNFAASLNDQERQQMLLRFFLDNNVVFWDSRYVGNPFAPQQLIANLARTAFRIDTPFLLLVVGLVGTGLALSGLLGRRRRAELKPGVQPAEGGLTRRPSWLPPLAGIVAGLSVLYLAISWTVDIRVPLRIGEEAASVPIVGIPRETFLLAALSTVIASVVGAALLDRLQAADRAIALPGHRWRWVAWPVGAWALFIYASPQFFNRGLSSLWFGALGGRWDPIVLVIALAGAVTTAVAIGAGWADRSLADPNVAGPLRGAAKVVGAGAVGLAAAYLVAPGYVSSGYLMRRVPMPVFFIDPMIAMVVYALGTVAWNTWPRGHGATLVTTVSARAARMGFSGAAGLATVLLVGYWVSLQVAHVTLMPPTGIDFMQRLSSAPYANASFVSNGYGVPITYFTRSWAYTDLDVGRNQPRAIDGRYELPISGKYVWFADREQNPAYRQPRYYLCWMTLDLKTATDGPTPGDPLKSCSAEPLFRAAELGSPAGVRNRVVERDSTGRDLWAIIELDPDVPLVPTWNVVGGQQAVP